MHRFAVRVALGLLVPLAAFPAAAQDGLAPPAFTAVQADEGALIYAAQCATCHGPELQGSGFSLAVSNADQSDADADGAPTARTLDRYRARAAGRFDSR